MNLGLMHLIVLVICTQKNVSLRIHNVLKIEKKAPKIGHPKFWVGSQGVNSSPVAQIVPHSNKAA